jgi:DNA-binding NarL/FixJ family response regulator
VNPMAEPKIGIVIVDDHHVVINGLKVLLLPSEHIEVLGTAHNADQLFSLLKGITPDIILLDLILPRISGIEITKRLKKEYPQLKIIIFTGNTPEDMIIEALEAGALGVIPKNSTQDELIESIHKTYNGEEYFGEKITHSLIKALINKSANNAEGKNTAPDILTAREKEIVSLFAEGYTYKEIAFKLSISVHTVESHKIKILKKLGLKTIIDLVKYAIKNNLIDI